MSPSAPTPRVKRAYQPSIADYFQHCDAPDEQNPYRKSHDLRDVPPMLQASLLSVGMRIRRAVPSGYQNTPATQTKSLTSPLREASANRSNVTMKAAELAPMCGIHKIGGLCAATTPPDDYSMLAFGEVVAMRRGAYHEDEDYLSSSQASIMTTESFATFAGQSSAPNQAGSRKRVYDDQEDILAQNRVCVDQDWDPMERPRLQAKTRIRREAASKLDASPNLVLDVQDDFEEAPFLSYHS